VNTVVGPHRDRPYATGTTSSGYAFDPETWFVPGDPNPLTAEDLLMFLVAVGNAHTNRPDALFDDNLPVADLDAMRDEGIVNAEFTFQRLVLAAVFDRFLAP
jgi:hypothetical protein